MDWSIAGLFDLIALSECDNSDFSEMTQSITIHRRFRGPPDSGNGGYSCALLGRFIDGPAAVRLSVPPPLGVPLEVRKKDGLVAAAWIPDATLVDASGFVAPEFIWAALDCPGAYAFPEPPNGALLLGELAVAIKGSVTAGEKCVLTGWEISRQGRKHYTGTALLVNRVRVVPWAMPPGSKCITSAQNSCLKPVSSVCPG